jgi:ribosomal protein L11 methyltransferase
MLKPPYTKYARIYTYHIDGSDFPAIADPDLIGSWVEDGKTILIFHKSKTGLVEKLCRRYNNNIFYQADIDYKDWEMGLEVLPFSVGPLTVAPVWDPQEADIKIDPSVVFGNGFHPSTRLCLKALVKYQKHLKPDFTGLDLGCGTGLLSIGAARLGASSMVAVDNNSLACEVTQHNVVSNGVQNKVQTRLLDLREGFPDTRVDVIMANLHHELLADLFQNPSFWQAELYILSGFMGHEEEKLLAALPENPPRFVDRGAMDKWRLWVLGNKTSTTRSV